MEIDNGGDKFFDKLDVKATIDTVTFAPVPLMTADKKPVPAKDYRALRWKVASLKAGDAIVVSIRVKVNQE